MFATLELQYEIVIIGYRLERCDKEGSKWNGDEDLGEVQEVGENYIMVQKGLINKDKFYIPKDMVESYDGDVLRFSTSEEDAKSRFMGDYPPFSTTENEGLAAARKAEETTTTVPITQERLNAYKRESTREATITKEPITETKTVEVPVTHEEISVERRPASVVPQRIDQYSQKLKPKFH